MPYTSVGVRYREGGCVRAGHETLRFHATICWTVRICVLGGGSRRRRHAWGSWGCLWRAAHTGWWGCRGAWWSTSSTARQRCRGRRRGARAIARASSSLLWRLSKPVGRRCFPRHYPCRCPCLAVSRPRRPRRRFDLPDYMGSAAEATARPPRGRHAGGSWAVEEQNVGLEPQQIGGRCCVTVQATRSGHAEEMGNCAAVGGRQVPQPARLSPSNSLSFPLYIPPS